MLKETVRILEKYRTKNNTEIDDMSNTVKDGVLEDKVTEIFIETDARC